nr:oligosaccharide flippase family protein [Neoroseomonas soli]
MRRSLLFSVLDRYGVYAFGLVGTVIAARLLTPADFGVFAVGASIVMLIDVMRDFGAGTYLVQVEEARRDVVRAAYTVSLLISLACAAALAAAAGPIARFYGEPGLAHVLLVLAGTFLTNPLSTAATAMLRRDMAFDVLAAISLAGAAVHLVVLVSLATLGHGYMAMAWAALASGLTRGAAANLARPMPWAFVPGLAGWRAVLAFGGWSTATAVVNVIHDALPQLMIGRILGAAPVGLFGRAQMVCQLPDKLVVSAVHPVVLPALAEHARGGGSLKEAFLLGIRHMTAVQWPALLCLALLADPVVHLLLGPQWSTVPHLVRIMAVGMLWLFPAFLTYPTLVTLGRIRDTLTLSLITIPPSLLLILLASFHSIEAVAATTWVTAPLQVLVALSFIRRHLTIGWGEIARAVCPGAVIALCTAAGPSLVVALGGFHLDISMPAMAIAIALAACGWLVGLHVSGHPLLAELLGLRRRLTRWA